MFWELPSSGAAASFGRISIRLILVAALILGVGAFLFYSASRKKAAIHARNLRWLAQTASQIREKVLSYDRIVERAGAAAKSGSNTNISFSITENRLRPFEFTRASEFCPDSQRFCVKDTDLGPLVRFRYDPALGETNLGTIVDQSVRSGVFSTIVLARRDGKVLYQSGREHLRLTNIAFLFEKSEAVGMLNWLPGAKPGGNAAPSSAILQGNKVDLPTVSIHLQRRIGDRDVEVYVQPLAVKAADEGDWLILGTIDNELLASTTSPKNLLLLLPLVLLLVAVSWPLPKPWLLAPEQPLRRRDVGRAVIGTFLIVLVLAMFGFYHYARVISAVRTDQQLNVLASSLGANLTREIKLGLRQLREMNNLALDQVKEGQPQWEFKGKLLNYIDADKIHSRFEFVDWVKDNGEKVIRWTPKDQDPVPVRVKDRHYFYDVLTGRTLTLSIGQGPKGEDLKSHFAIEQVLSRTTGQIVTMLAIPSWLPNQKENGKPLPVASIGLLLASVRNVVVPSGFGFAIIDRDGRVLFHSDESRVLAENFFDECPDSTELPGILDRRVRAGVNATYGGVPHRLMLTPVPGLEILPWTLVAFRNMEPIHQFRAQGLVDTVALMVAAAILSIVPFALIFLFLRRSNLSGRRVSIHPKSMFDLAWWTRPGSFYPYVAVAGVLFAVIVLRAIQERQGSLLFYGAVVAGVGFLALSAWGVRYRGGLKRSSLRGLIGAPVLLLLTAGYYRDWVMAIVAPVLLVAAGWALARWAGTGPPWQMFYRSAWLVWTAAYAFCLCVAPVFFLAKYAYEYETGLHARDIQWRLWRDSEQREQRYLAEIDSFVGSDGESQKRDRLTGSLGLPHLPGTCPPLYSYALAGYNTLLLSHDEPAQRNAPPGNGCYALPPPYAPAKGSGCEAVGSGPNSSRFASVLPNLVLAGVELGATERAMGFDVRQGEMQPWLDVWRWCTERGEDGAFLWLIEPQGPAARTDAPTFRPFSLLPISGVKDEVTTGQASVPARIAEILSGLEVWGGLTLLMAALMFWANRLRAQVLQLGPGFSENGIHLALKQAKEASHRLVLARTAVARFALSDSTRDYTEIDFASEEPSEYLDGRRLPTDGLLVLHLESRFWDETARLSRLALLEKALIYQDRKMVVISAIDPLRYLRTGGAGALGTKAQPAELQRWRRVMNHFAIVDMTNSQQTIPANPAEIWDSCSEQEQLVLAQLEKHKLVNPAAVDVLLALVGRGLVRRARSQRWTFCNAEFRRFVNFAGFPPGVEELQPSAVRKKAPVLTAGLFMIGVILFLTQEEATTRMIGFLTSVTGGFEAIRRQIAGGGSAEKKQ